jgi:hypothetical protein
MPELPEVETVCRGLEPALAGRRIASVRLNRPDLRFPFPAGLAEALAGAEVSHVERRAKYILVHLSNGAIMLAHLGMTGRFTVWRADGEAQNLGEFYFAEEAGRQGDGPHDHMVIDLEDGTRIVYADPRRFGFVDLIAPGAMEGNRFLAGLGWSRWAMASTQAILQTPLPDERHRSRRHCWISASLQAWATYMCVKRSTGPGCRRAAWPAPSCASGVPARALRHWWLRCARFWVRPFLQVAPPCAIMPTPTDHQVRSSSALTSMTAKASPAGRRDARQPSGASCNRAGRRSTAPLASDSGFAVYCAARTMTIEPTGVRPHELSEHSG